MHVYQHAHTKFILKRYGACRTVGGSKASATHAEKRFREVSEAYEVLSNGRGACSATYLCMLRHIVLQTSHICAESKRDLYNRGLASGRGSQPGTQWASTSQPYYGAPRAHSGWTNFRYRQKKYPGKKTDLLPMLCMCGWVRTDWHMCRVAEC